MPGLSAHGWRSVRRLAAVVALASFVSSCTAGAAPAVRASRSADADRVEGRCWGERVADSARWFLRHQQKTGRRDCSGLVEAILARAGVAVRGSTSALWLDAARAGRLVVEPWPGDLAFFDGTWDANRNGKVDDDLTHVAVVTRIDCDGTVHMVHRTGHGPIGTLRMNIDAPSDRDRNDFLRAHAYGPKGGSRLSGELLRIFARPPSP